MLNLPFIKEMTWIMKRNILDDQNKLVLYTESSLWLIWNIAISIYQFQENQDRQHILKMQANGQKFEGTAS